MVFTCINHVPLWGTVNSFDLATKICIGDTLTMKELLKNLLMMELKKNMVKKKLSKEERG